MIHQKDQIIKRIEEISLLLKKFIGEKNIDELETVRNDAVNEFNKTSILDLETICSMDDNSFKHFAALESSELDPKKIYIAQLLLLDVLYQKNSGESVPDYKFEKLDMVKDEIGKYESEDVKNLMLLISSSGIYN